MQRELFDAHILWRRCKACRAKLHPDSQGRFETRLVGLCYRCKREWERSLISVETFCLEYSQADQGLRH